MLPFWQAIKTRTSATTKNCIDRDFTTETYHLGNNNPNYHFLNITAGGVNICLPKVTIFLGHSVRILLYFKNFTGQSSIFSKLNLSIRSYVV